MAFRLGRLTASCGIATRMADDTVFHQFVLDSLHRYREGDWGVLSKSDKQANTDAIANGDRIFAAYASQELRSKIWIITEADRNYTTILFPSEY